MKEEMKVALLRSYDLRVVAGKKQAERGVTDVGNRAQITAGTHMNTISELIVEDLIASGISKRSLFYNKKDSEIPGWFRATKQWDILAFDKDQLVAAIELKSISSSYGNNMNNRTEEALGEAIDAKFSMNRGLLNRVTPPILAYAMIVKKDETSQAICKKPSSHHFSYDPIFEDTSYLDRFSILCQRLRREEIFGAVWFVVVDPVARTVEEPVPELSYERFLSEIKGRVEAFKL